MHHFNSNGTTAQRVVCLLCLVMSSLPQQNRSLSLKGPHYYKFLQSVQLVQANTPSPLAQQTDTDLREYLRGPAFEIFQIREYLRGPAFEIFQMLIAELDYEGRYLFLNSIANQLQYPNNLTHFFYMVLLNLFAEPNQVSLSLAHVLLICVSFQLCIEHKIQLYATTKLLLSPIIG